MTNNTELPDFIIIGAMKCGTTSLWEYLKQHPQICIPHDIKNIEYFDSNENWHKGISFYKSHFKADEKTKSIGELSTEYTKYPNVKNVAKNIYATLPDVKFIYLIRHPIERLISHYIHSVGAAKEYRDINTALQNTKDNPYILYSQYFFQLEQFLKYYKKESFLILTSDDLLARKNDTLNTLFNYINVDTCGNTLAGVKKHTRSSKKSWNRIGRMVRKSPKYFNRYNYYTSRLPNLYAKRIERLFCRPIDEPVINETNLQYLNELFSQDLNRLQEHTNFQIPNWKLTK